MLEIKSNLIKITKTLVVFCVAVLPNVSFSQKEINLPKLKLNQQDSSGILTLSKEIEIEHRDQIVSVLKKTNECINNSLTLGMISVCKAEETAEIKSIKQTKQELEKTYLKKINSR